MSQQTETITIKGKGYLILPLNFIEAILKKSWEIALTRKEKDSWCKLSAAIYRLSYKEGFVRQSRGLITPELLQTIKKKIDEAAKNEGDLPF